MRKSSMAVCIDQDYAKFTPGSILSDADLISFCYQIACGMVSVHEYVQLM